jgi:hypothetical protein
MPRKQMPYAGTRRNLTGKLISIQEFFKAL